jgi:hypothetical protein
MGMRLEDLADFQPFDRQRLATVLVDSFGVSVSNEGYYCLETVGDVLEYFKKHGKEHV